MKQGMLRKINSGCKRGITLIFKLMNQGNHYNLKNLVMNMNPNQTMD
jgi:hypothetical protein